MDDSAEAAAGEPRESEISPPPNFLPPRRKPDGSLPRSRGAAQCSAPFHRLPTEPEDSSSLRRHRPQTAVSGSKQARSASPSLQPTGEVLSLKPTQSRRLVRSSRRPLFVVRQINCSLS